MSDDTEIADEQQAEAEDRGPLAGERLAEARRGLQIPVIEIAKELHLDEYKVRAIEENDFEVIGAPVFAKGHLRKYAQLVNVNEADVMADYYQLERTGPAPLLVATRRRQPREFSVLPWLLVLLIAGLAGVAYWWFALRESVAQTPEAATIATPAVATLQRDSIELPTVTPTEVDEPAPTPDEAPAATSNVPEPVVVESPPEFRVVIQYSGDSWSEISDASGRRLFFDLGKAGRTVNLTGDPPFNALFGNADNVSIRVNGENYAIPPASRRGRTARLTIDES